MSKQEVIYEEVMKGGLFSHVRPRIFQKFHVCVCVHK